MKKLVSDSKRVIGCYESRTRDEMIKEMDQALKSLSPTERKTAKFSLEKYYESYDPNEYTEFRVEWQRLETDEEEQKREAMEAENAERRAKYEKAEYERLKKQFEANK